MFRIGCLSFLLLLLGCGTTFYTRVFRLESITPKKYYYALPKEMIDGKFAEFAGWDWLIRVVCLYETNNKTATLSHRILGYASTIGRQSADSKVSG